MTALLLCDVRLGIGGPRVDVAVTDGRVSAIGPDLPHTGEVVDGQGGTVLPGLVDVHVHMTQWAGSRRRIPLAHAKSAAEAVGTIARLADSKPGELVMGHGFRDGAWPDVPHKDLLERALPGTPVALFSNDLHTLWLSPAALRLIGRDHPTGVLLENDCMAATAELPAATDEWVLDATDAAAARGVTEIVDYEYADTVTDWLRRLALRRPGVRVSAVVSRPLLDSAIARGHRTGDVIPGTDGMLKVGPYKLFVDGSLNTRTAYCHDPYPGQDTHGLLELPFDELVVLMQKASRHGITPAVHAIGDRANTIALDAFAKVGCPGRIEHAQLVHPGDLPRFAELGVVAGVQPAHQPDDRDVADRHWSGRTGNAFPYAALLAAGATLEIGSDAPVAPLDPWDGIASAVSRTDDTRPAWHPEQAIALDIALAAASRGRREIRVGDPADLTVTEVDPGTLAPHDLREIPIVLTMIGGRLTHLR
ncbi:Exoenzymes regulatory protein AepA in lipid-linked oligosaccharide synthesis cluster [Kibdelosporangium sp. 4NS15]|uniref:Exoenzymes regulatory protein AepA in lipid-linked oligosaccharide synthesis cluster n=1 Tax=Kibdelosporangium persicum TaxID=2698649 RepID=A0ABX2FIT5_9PSEU|nr:amidohydrolase family protein [Kibdelosporangium persicum]NRN71334.1 Exoenzymes regulatory protein AepA in lipid-linked oligosaccharide synthesis cluster [Kibdelosporangium persicum]